MFLSLFISCSNGIKLHFIADQNLPQGTLLNGHEVGGLSGLIYDEKLDRFFAVADVWNRENRILEMSLQFNDGKPSFKLEKFLFLKDKNGKALPKQSYDHEAIAIGPQGNFILANEGIYEEDQDGNTGAYTKKPTLDFFSRDGILLSSLALPQIVVEYSVKNRVIEGLSYRADEKMLYASLETPISVDGPESDLDRPAKLRFLKWKWEEAKGFVPAGEINYELSAIPRDFSDQERDSVMSQSRSSGVSEIASYGNSFFVLERGFLRGLFRSTGEIYQRTAEGKKEKVLNLRDIEPLMTTKNLDNFEGMAIGPKLPNGHRLLVLLSDDNFSKYQRTVFVFFEIKD